MPIRSLMTPRLVIPLINHGTLTFVDQCVNVLIPLYYSTSIPLGGLGFTPFKIGIIMSVFGCEIHCYLAFVSDTIYQRCERFLPTVRFFLYCPPSRPAKTIHLHIPMHGIGNYMLSYRVLYCSEHRRSRWMGVYRYNNAAHVYCISLFELWQVPPPLFLIKG
jgi:hypothetical protein